MDGDFAFGIRLHEKHAVSLQNLGGIGNNKFLLRPIRNSFSARVRPPNEQ